MFIFIPRPPQVPHVYRAPMRHASPACVHVHVNAHTHAAHSHESHSIPGTSWLLCCRVF